MEQLREVLRTRRDGIVRRWFDYIIETYPEETAAFLKSKRDPFTNPVGSTIKEGIEGIIDYIVGEGEEEVQTFLDRIIRIRAVQDFKPSEAVEFVFHLKDIVRAEVGMRLDEPEIRRQLREFDSSVDKLALLAFDIFMECREKIYELKATELKNMTYKLLERAKLLDELDKHKW